MRLEKLCEMDLKYVGGFHMIRPYGNEAGIGWGVGDGSVTGERLSGAVRWSNQPRRRGDGSMLPNARGVIVTPDGADVLFDLTGRTTWVEQGGTSVGRQLLMTLFESEAEAYSWLNNTLCVAEGRIDPETLVLHLDVHLCHSEIV